MRRLLAAALLAVLAACSSSTIATPPTSPPVVTPARGSLISTTRVGTITRAQMSAGLAGSVISELGGPPQCDVALYALRYNTIGVNAEPADASAAFMVPLKGCKTGPYLLVGYAQGTNVIRAQKITHPTKRNIEPTVIAAIYAAHGYAVAATDYLGLGFSTYPFAPYLVDDAEASAVIDSMRAARHAARSLGVALSRDAFLTGHSQGGQSSMATQRTLEAQNPHEFHLIADAPSSGPYALSQTMIDGWRHPGQNAAVLAAYALTSFQHTYGNVYNDAADVFKEPYAKWIDALLPVTTYAQAGQLEGQTIPNHLHQLLRGRFVDGFLNDPSSGARVDAARNDLLSGWKPVAPLALCGGSGDPQVEYANTLAAYKFFRGEGAKVTMMDVNSLMPPSVPKSLYHDAVLVLCLTLNRKTILDALPTVRRAL